MTPRTMQLKLKQLQVIAAVRKILASFDLRARSALTNFAIENMARRRTHLKGETFSENLIIVWKIYKFQKLKPLPV